MIKKISALYFRSEIMLRRSAFRSILFTMIWFWHFGRMPVDLWYTGHYDNHSDYIRLYKTGIDS